MTACATQDKAFIELPALRPQYPYAITDQGFNLRRRPFNATVAWNVMPRVGAIATRQRSFTGAAWWRPSAWWRPTN